MVRKGGFEFSFQCLCNGLRLFLLRYLHPAGYGEVRFSANHVRYEWQGVPAERSESPVDRLRTEIISLNGIAVQRFISHPGRIGETHRQCPRVRRFTDATPTAPQQSPGATAHEHRKTQFSFRPHSLPRGSGGRLAFVPVIVSLYSPTISYSRGFAKGRRSQTATRHSGRDSRLCRKLPPSERPQPTRIPSGS